MINSQPIPNKNLLGMTDEEFCDWFLAEYIWEAEQLMKMNHIEIPDLSVPWSDFVQRAEKSGIWKG